MNSTKIHARIIVSWYDVNSYYVLEDSTILRYLGVTSKLLRHLSTFPTCCLVSINQESVEEPQLETIISLTRSQVILSMVKLTADDVIPIHCFSVIRS